MVEATAVAATSLPPVAMPKLKQQKALSFKSRRKQKSPPQMPAVTVVAVAVVSDMTQIPVTCTNSSKNPAPLVVIESDSDSDATDATQGE